MRVCRSPKLIAAYRDLHRLYVPRHPPHTFIRLTLSQLVQAKHALLLYFSSSCGAQAFDPPELALQTDIALRLTEVLRPLRRQALADFPSKKDPRLLPFFRCQTASLRRAKPLAIDPRFETCRASDKIRDFQTATAPCETGALLIAPERR